MKIRIYANRAAIVDYEPLIIDVREKNYIEVEKPDDKAYFFGFDGVVKERREVIDGKVELPKTYYLEQSIKIIVYRAEENGFKALPCEPIKVFRVDNKEMFLMNVAGAIGQEDVRDTAKRALEIHEKTAKRLAELAEQLTEVSEKVSLLKADLEGFHALYNENVEKINDVIRRVEIMEADYDVLVK